MRISGLPTPPFLLASYEACPKKLENTAVVEAKANNLHAYISDRRTWPRTLLQEGSQYPSQYTWGLSLRAQSGMSWRKNLEDEKINPRDGKLEDSDKPSKVVNMR